MLDVDELDAFLCLLAKLDDERRELESILPPPAKKLPSRVPPPPCTTSKEPFFAALTELPNSPLDNGRNDIAELQVDQALEGKHASSSAAGHESRAGHGHPTSIDVDEHESAVVDDNVTVEMGDHDSEQMDDLKSAVLRRCFTPRTKQQRAALRRRQAEKRQRASWPYFEIVDLNSLTSLNWVHRDGFIELDSLNWTHWDR